MNTLQTNSRFNLFKTLEYLSSKEEQISYKEAVPFVDIPGELICQWDANFIKKGQKWFREIWNDNEWNTLLEFDIVFRRLTKRLPKKTPDIPEIYNYEEWNEIMTLSREVLEKIKLNKK